jgi:putative transposase
MPIERKHPLVEPEHDRLSVARQCELLGMSRASYYYEPWEWDATALEVIRALDEEYTLHPCKGKRRMCDHLRELGYDVGVRRTRTLMAWLGLEAIYPKKSLSTSNREHKKYPFSKITITGGNTAATMLDRRRFTSPRNDDKSSFLGKMEK